MMIKREKPPHPLSCLQYQFSSKKNLKNILLLDNEKILLHFAEYFCILKMKISAFRVYYKPDFMILAEKRCVFV